MSWRGDNAEQVPISENGRNTGTDAPPEGTDPLLWELGQLRKVAQGALTHAARTHNLSATASLLRAANGLLDLLARIEKTKAEELKAQQATASLPSPDTIEEIQKWLAGIRARIAAAQAMQQPPTPALKCPRCGQALPHGVQVEEEEPKPDGPGVH